MEPHIFMKYVFAFAVIARDEGARQVGFRLSDATIFQSHKDGMSKGRPPLGSHSTSFVTQ